VQVGAQRSFVLLDFFNKPLGAVGILLAHDQTQLRL